MSEEPDPALKEPFIIGFNGRHARERPFQGRLVQLRPKPPIVSAPPAPPRSIQLAVTFLTPWMAVFAGAAGFSSLLLLYFLKLRRRQVDVPAVFLWRRAVEDLHANAPFQRLRFTWLLVLQLLIVTLLALAAGRPTLGTDRGASERVILILDTSASMKALGAATTSAGADRGRSDRSDGIPPEDEAVVTRFDLAREAAREIIDRPGAGSAGGETMIITAASTARVAQGFTADQSRLRGVVDALTPLDEVGRLGPALRLAEAFVASESAAAPGSAAAANGGGTGAARIIVISDGRFADGDSWSIRGDAAIEFLSIVPATSSRAGDASVDGIVEPTAPPDANQSLTENLGVVTLSARRRSDDPATVEILATIINTAPVERLTPVSLDVNGQRIEAQSVRVPAAEIASPSPRAGGDISMHAIGNAAPGEASVRFRIVNTSGAVARVRQGARDSLAVDDAAGLRIPALKRSRLLVVAPEGEPDPLLMSVLELLEFDSIDRMTTSELDAINTLSPPDRNERLSPYELVVFDRSAPAFVPGIPSLSFGAAPPLPGVRIDRAGASESNGDVERVGRRVLSWSRNHPVMRDVNLDSIVIGDSRRLELDEGAATALAIAPGGAIIATGEAQQQERHIVTSFDLDASNWPIHVSFAIFIQNAVDYLTSRARSEAGLWTPASEPVTASLLDGAQRVEVTGPRDFAIEVDETDAEVTLPPLREAGVYDVSGVTPPHDVIIVNLLSRVESNLTPVHELSFAGDEARSRSLDGPTPREVWMWFALAAFGVLMLEWLVYGWRAQGGGA